jgi:hypothetical protein
MRAKTVNETLNERMDPRDQEVRYTNIPVDLSKRYHMEGGKIVGVKNTKEMARERKKAEARKRMEQSAVFRAKFPATMKGVRELEDWASIYGDPGDYVLRPIDLPSAGIGEIVAYDDESGLGTEITRDLRRDYAASADEGDYYNVSPIRIDHWSELDDEHKLRSRIRTKEEKVELAPDIIRKHD